MEPHLCDEFPNDNPALWLRPALPKAEPEPEAPPVSTVAPDVRDDDDDYARFAQLLVETALLAGATRAAALASSILADDRVPPEHRHFAEIARAWRAVLSGRGDLASCGDEPLDEWAAALLATLMGSPEERGSLRRELRARGVAAFGLIARAA